MAAEDRAQGDEVERSKLQDAPDHRLEDERAERYLNIWERNLSYFALNGPAFEEVRRKR